MQKISAVIITYNEEKKITACLSSLQGVADEVIVLDSFSTDKTPDICKKYGVKFYQQAWAGYGEQKNNAVAKASNDYILSLDADECLSSQLQKSILSEKKNKLEGVYRFNRLNIFYGYVLKYGATQPDKIIRLYNRQLAKWSLKDVHETLELSANTSVNELKGNLEHYTKDNLHDFVYTINKYSTLSSQYYYSKGKRSNIYKIIASPAFTFFSSYFLRLGFLDGIPGLIMAVTISLETFLKYSKLYFLQKEKSK